MRVPLLVGDDLSCPQRHEVRAQHEHTHQVQHNHCHADARPHHRTASPREAQAQGTGQQQNQERLEGQRVEVEHRAGRVHKPREIAGTEHQQQRAETPVPLEQEHE